MTTRAGLPAKATPGSANLPVTTDPVPTTVSDDITAPLRIAQRAPILDPVSVIANSANSIVVPPAAYFSRRREDFQVTEIAIKNWVRLAKQEWLHTFKLFNYMFLLLIIC
ncbi:hypothetical protein [Bradyrhizobium sp. AUGA SZCCT0042]|uniref:hypothetical protein n=1 Tax=Bradyrhizobium sp. AUGA SZCCT0042 TaxID=2807651 RepID=UPI001BA46109|nr:hypothetical protein [Bradyrhizobium sp. AUGA SZCCT0042]MBR1301772.1 hypothetical protein [Bradyrhizobium sp. AUGA SZCCT0042]